MPPDDDARGPRLLLAGDAADLPSIRAELIELPNDAHGTVFVEVFNAVQIVHIDAPSGVAVHWLFRQNARGTVAPRGAALVRAVELWLDEWSRPDDGVDVHLWLGCRSSSVVNALARRLEHEFARA